MATVFCRTEGCSSVGSPVAFAMTFIDADTGLPRAVDAVFCGACGERITDIEG